MGVLRKNDVPSLLKGLFVASCVSEAVYLLYMSLRFKTSAGDWGGWVNSGYNGRVRQRVMSVRVRSTLD